MKDPVAGKLGVRKAIAYLLDPDTPGRKEVYQDSATPLYSVVPGGHRRATPAAFFDD
ncbi:ABC transporter substrate-binding protein OS=Streptomyces alboniger OX=132473 GN=CP975_06455 PE=3 SV=1 [Streptomyces alboniger]